MSFPLSIVSRDNPHYPVRVRERLGPEAPAKFEALGAINLMALTKTALFCSARCPGDVILRAYDQAAKWRETDRCVISGFHSPVEEECFRILLRGSQPIIVCPARALPQRLPQSWKKPLASGRMLVVSAFDSTAARVTAELAHRRNCFVAALADDVFIAHATPGGHLANLMHILHAWNIPLSGAQRDYQREPRL